MGLDYHKTIKDNKSKRVVGNIGGMTDASTRNAAQLTLNFQHLQKHFVLQKRENKNFNLEKKSSHFFVAFQDQSPSHTMVMVTSILATLKLMPKIKWTG